MVKVKGIKFANQDGFQHAALGKMAEAAALIGDKLADEIKGYTDSHGWNHQPGFVNGDVVTSGMTVLLDVGTVDKVYLWVDKGTRPISITGKTTTPKDGQVVGKMSFRFAGRGASYASKTDGMSGGDGRGQIGKPIRAANIYNRSVRARNITQSVINESRDAIIEAGQEAMN